MSINPEGYPGKTCHKATQPYEDAVLNQKKKTQETEGATVRPVSQTRQNLQG